MFSPAIDAAPPSGYSFNMTAGDPNGSIQGYSNGSLLPAFGSIDAEPISGETLLYLATGSIANEMRFDGDIVSLLSGLTVWVDSVEYPGNGDWFLSSGDTFMVWSAPNAPVFVDTTMYFIEIK